MLVLSNTSKEIAVLTIEIHSFQRCCYHTLHSRKKRFLPLRYDSSNSKKPTSPPVQRGKFITSPPARNPTLYQKHVSSLILDGEEQTSRKAGSRSSKCATISASHAPSPTSSPTLSGYVFLCRVQDFLARAAIIHSSLTKSAS
jgi:hypothetical protein